MAPAAHRRGSWQEHTHSPVPEDVTLRTRSPRAKPPQEGHLDPSTNDHLNELSTSALLKAQARTSCDQHSAPSLQSEGRETSLPGRPTARSIRACSADTPAGAASTQARRMQRQESGGGASPTLSLSLRPAWDCAPARGRLRREAVAPLCPRRGPAPRRLR